MKSSFVVEVLADPASMVVLDVLELESMGMRFKIFPESQCVQAVDGIRKTKRICVDDWVTGDPSMKDVLCDQDVLRHISAVTSIGFSSAPPKSRVVEIVFMSPHYCGVLPSVIDAYYKKYTADSHTLTFTSEELDVLLEAWYLYCDQDNADDPDDIADSVDKKLKGA